MGIQELGKLISYASKAPVKCTELVSKPVITRMLEGEFKLATELIGDTCHFSRVDRSLNPEFLKELLKIEGKTPLETYNKIKDKMMKAMGFTHPEKLALRTNSFMGYMLNYDIHQACIEFNLELIKKECFIAAIRHELEHMKQAVKLYKAKGKEKFAEVLHKLFYKQNKTGTLIEPAINTEFYEAMAKDVSATAAEGEKYYKAYNEYTPLSSKFSDRYEYFNNQVEKEAYAVQKKVQQALGMNDKVAPDFFPANYKTLLSLLETKGIPIEQHELLLQDLFSIAQIKGIETPESILKYIKINRKFVTDGVLTPDEEILIQELSQKLSKILTQDRNYNKQVEAWLREGKYTVEDVLKDL